MAKKKKTIPRISDRTFRSLLRQNAIRSFLERGLDDKERLHRHSVESGKLTGIFYELIELAFVDIQIPARSRKLDDPDTIIEALVVSSVAALMKEKLNFSPAAINEISQKMGVPRNIFLAYSLKLFQSAIIKVLEEMLE